MHGYLELIGIAVMVAGFALRANPLLVVLLAGFATGLAAGMSFVQVIAQFGTQFVENRYMALPVILMLPLIGMLERHGLRERAEQLIANLRAATAGRVLLLYSVARQIAISLGVKIGDHAATVRPLLVPMAEAAAKRQLGPAAGALPDELSQSIRAHAAAAENVGNFFGEDIFVAVGAVLLMSGYFQSVGMTVSLWALAWWGIPTAVMAFLLMAWRTRVLDRRIKSHATRAESARIPASSP